MNPPDPLWRKYLEEIGRLEKQGDISSEDYDLLSLSTPARAALMDFTSGDLDVFTEGTVSEILQRAQAAARASTEEALREERQARYETKRQAQINRIRSQGAMAGRWISRAFKYTGGILLIAGTYLVLFLPDFPGGWWLPFIISIFIVFGIAGIANLVFGATLTSLSRRLEVVVSGLAERVLRRVVGL